MSANFLVIGNNFTVCKKLVLLSVILFYFNVLEAQKRNASPLSTTENKLTFLNDSLEREDSSLTHFENYKPLSFVQDLGNLASPYRLMYFKTTSLIGFNTGWYAPFDYFNSSEKTNYYKTSVPFTLGSYYSGQRPSNALDYLQIIGLEHTQNWGPLFNIGVKYNSYRCNGFSTHAETRTASGQFFAWFHAPNFRYQLLANANFSSASNNLNGGIVNDSNYENSSGVTKEIEGLLKDSSLYIFKLREYSVKYLYRFGKETMKINTRQVRRDSTTHDTLRNIDTRLQLAYTINFKTESWEFIDNIAKELNFYHNYYFDTLRSKDTLHQNTLTNLVELTFPTKFKALFYAAYENRLHWIYQFNTGKYLMNESILHQKFQKTFFSDSTKGLLIKENLSYCLFNNFKEFSQGDYLIDGSAMFTILKIQFNIKSLFASQSPSLLQVYNPGSHFYWYNNSFSKQQTSSLIVEISDIAKNNLLQLNYSRINNYTYFDTTVTPLQARGINYISLTWKQDIKIRALHYTHAAIWQTSSNSIALAIPKILLKATIMYDDNWFKKALHIQVGATANYFSKYYAPSFMPSVNVFYTQTKKEIGNYWQLDGFVNLQIQRLRIFIVYEHFNQGIAGFGTNSYITPHYPIANTALRFGICWSFYN